MSICFPIRKKVLKFFAPLMPGNGVRVRLYKASSYVIGKDVYMGEGVLIIDKLSDKKNVIIGDRVAISPRVILVTSSGPNFSKIAPYVKTEHGTIQIEDDAWIGAGAIILPDIIIGTGAVVGAGAVVTKNVEKYTIVAGVPAKKIAEVDVN